MLELASLVQEQKATLEGAGVDIYSTSSQVPSSKVKGALPTRVVPALPKTQLIAQSVAEFSKVGLN